MGWATMQDVQALTGRADVDDAALDMATGIIELTSGGRVATTGDVQLSDRNLDWLRRAVVYQAVFMVEHPDFFTRMEVSSFTQDGASGNIRSDGLVLAPLARRCLKRLSWRGVRTVRANREVVTVRAVYTSDDYDDRLPYRPL